MLTSAAEALELAGRRRGVGWPESATLREFRDALHPAAGGVESAGIYLVESSGAYLLARAWVRDADKAVFMQLASSLGFAYGPSHFSLLSLSGATRYEDGAWRDARPVLTFEYYDHFSPRQTLAFNIRTEALRRGPVDDQILLADRG